MNAEAKGHYQPAESVDVDYSRLLDELARRGAEDRRVRQPLASLS